MSPSQLKPLPPYLKTADNGCTLAVRVQPNARKTAVVGEHGDLLKIQVQAPPIDGKANETLTKWLAEILNVSKSQVTLVRGASNRAKVFHIEGKTAGKVFELLKALLPRN